MAGNTRATAYQVNTGQYFRHFVVDQSAEPPYPRRIKDWWWNCDKNWQEMRMEKAPTAAKLRAENSASDGQLCRGILAIVFFIVQVPHHSLKTMIKIIGK